MISVKIKKRYEITMLLNEENVESLKYFLDVGWIKHTEHSRQCADVDIQDIEKDKVLYRDILYPLLSELK